MKTVRMVLQEILHRKVNFLLSLLSVTVATGGLTGAVLVLRLDDDATARILAARHAAVREAGAALEDSMRRITKGLGFNVLILPADQDLSQLHLEGTLSKSMPEEYVDRLARSGIVTVNHLLPSVVQKIAWPEYGLSVILQGTRGEVPLLHADPKQPLLDAVPPGGMVLGHEVQRRLGVSAGDQVRLRGGEFTITKIHEERGTIDDLTVWVHLADAQRMLGMENLIHAILALECHCAGERLPAIRREISGILPGTQVIERGPPALARTEARDEAKNTALRALALEQANRAALRQQRERVAQVLLPLVLFGAAVWIGFLAFTNVRERRSEIGMLHALGFGSPAILTLFLGRSLVIGVVGGFLGSGLGLAGALAIGPGAVSAGLMGLGFLLKLLGLGLGVAVALSGLGSWLPALVGARQDPAVLLQDH